MMQWADKPTVDRLWRNAVVFRPSTRCHAFVASRPLLFAMSGWRSPKGQFKSMPRAKLRASTILAEFHKAEAELVGKAVILTGGKAGTVEHVWLDDLHGLRISVRGHEGKWPVSTIKLAEREQAAS